MAGDSSDEVQGSTLAAFERELHEIIRRGLPVTYKTAGPILLGYVGFEGNLARTSVEKMLPFAAKLDSLIREQLDAFDNDELRPAAHILFGYAPGSRGRNITKRVELAAVLMECDIKTVNRRRQQIVQHLAWQIYRAHAGGVGSL